jgi:biopolymer transport protein ExbD
MKRQVIIFLPLAFLIVSCNGQNISKDKVPSLVLNTLKAKYPLINDVDWEKHTNLYEAELDLNDSTEISVRIDEAGGLIMQKQDVPHSNLTSEIAGVIKSQYTDYTIDDVEKIEKDGVIYYQVELKGKNKKEVNLVLLPDGTQEKKFSYWD